MQKLSIPKIFTHNMITNPPNAYALIHGSKSHPDIWGIVKFYSTPYKGLTVCAEIFNLPIYSPNGAPSFFGFHIHETGDCSDNFANTGGHYNPDKQTHPFHVGDLPPLISSDGYAFMCVYVRQLNLKEIFGRSVIIHSQADDFTSQPSGNSGEKIACGVIE